MTSEPNPYALGLFLLFKCSSLLTFLGVKYIVAIEKNHQLLKLVTLFMLVNTFFLSINSRTN